MISTILGDVIVGSITVIIAIIIFEIIFYFVKINKDIESGTINAINNIPDINIDIKTKFCYYIDSITFKPKVKIWGYSII